MAPFWNIGTLSYSKVTEMGCFLHVAFHLRLLQFSMLVASEHAHGINYYLSMRV